MNVLTILKDFAFWCKSVLKIIQKINQRLTQLAA